MIQQETILPRLQQIVREILRRETIVLTNETTSTDIDGWDSLTHMLIIAEIEKQFGIRINFRELMRIQNIGELIATIEKKTS